MFCEKQEKIKRKKAQYPQPPYLLMVHSPSVSQSICIGESIWTSCLHVPADFLKMRINTHIQSDNLAACVWERQRLWLDWIGDREMRPALQQQRSLIGWQVELSLFPPILSLVSLLLSSMPHRTGSPDLPLCYFSIKKIKWSDDYQACVMRSIIKNNSVLTFVCPL